MSSTDGKMTSGEIAKKAGVSQKAIRLYDEKGLLKPAGYSEGNYRLYDEASLQVLEKIVALKQIGFSLEEIRDNIVSGDAKDIREALEIQLKVMEEKRYRTDMVIDAIKRTLAQSDESPDWDDVASIVQSVTIDQSADRHHMMAVRHTLPGMDWYVTIFRSLQLKKEEKVLDLGCGFSKLWRNNWKDIPEGAEIYAYDVHGSWADDFEKFISGNERELPAGVRIDLTFGDLEKDATWEKIEKEKKYSRIVAHYLFYELKDPEALVARAGKVLAEDGICSMNGPDISPWNLYFQEAMKEAGIDAPFIKTSISEQKKARDAFRSMVSKHFKKVEIRPLQNSLSFDSADDIFLRMKDQFDGQEKFFLKNGDKIKAFFEKKLEQEGELILTIEYSFLHCSL
ncbi:MAG: MerR family transcriptional regulator [Saccharofermentanaceae bacterium]|nr:MerR family transcriptional regulator [Saccharofermentanaceae bacterium]